MHSLVFCPFRAFCISSLRYNLPPFKNIGFLSVLARFGFKRNIKIAMNFKIKSKLSKQIKTRNLSNIFMTYLSSISTVHAISQSTFHGKKSKVRFIYAAKIITTICGLFIYIIRIIFINKLRRRTIFRQGL